MTKQIWKSPNGKYRFIEVKAFHPTSGAYTDRGYVAYVTVENGPYDYSNLYLHKSGRVDNPRKLPKYIVEKASSLMKQQVVSRKPK